MTRYGRAWPLLGLLALGLALSGCAAGQPFMTTAHTGVSGRNCGLAQGDPTGERVTVDLYAGSVTAVWLPGLTGRCAPDVTHGGRSTASALASDIRAAPPPPSGVFHCPADTRHGVSLYFSYGRGHADERVDVDLTGCGTLTAPGRSPRTLPAHLRRDLVPITPPEWLHLVRYSQER